MIRFIFGLKIIEKKELWMKGLKQQLAKIMPRGLVYSSEENNKRAKTFKSD